MANKHVALEPPETLQDRFRDAIAPRTLALGVGVLLLQLGFILSYLGAFHSPTPHHVPVAVVAPAQAAGQIVDKLNGLAGEPIAATAAAGEDAARQALRAGETSGGLPVQPGRHRGPAAGRLRRWHRGLRRRSSRSSPRSPRRSSAPSPSTTSSRCCPATPAGCPGSISSSAGWSAATCSPRCSASRKAHGRRRFRVRCGAWARRCPTRWLPGSAVRWWPSRCCTR